MSLQFNDIEIERTAKITIHLDSEDKVTAFQNLIVCATDGLKAWRRRCLDENPSAQSDVQNLISALGNI